MEMDLNGNWEGIITLGKEYGKDEGKEIIYYSELAQKKNKISGISYDVSGFGTNPDPADINGEIEGSKINFAKQYRTRHIAAENDEIEIDTSRKGPKIYYVGIFNESNNTFEGNWTMSATKVFFGLIPIGIKSTGTWTMTKK
tara:strand:+ start:65 stop:490 length:426 start_codon:yes stop_codon:yes gene_type:complete